MPRSLEPRKERAHLNKKVTGRMKDLADVEALQALKASEYKQTTGVFDDREMGALRRRARLLK